LAIRVNFDFKDPQRRVLLRIISKKRQRFHLSHREAEQLFQDLRELRCSPYWPKK